MPPKKITGTTNAGSSASSRPKRDDVPIDLTGDPSPPAKGARKRASNGDDEAGAKKAKATKPAPQKTGEKAKAKAKKDGDSEFKGDAVSDEEATDREPEPGARATKAKTANGAKSAPGGREAAKHRLSLSNQTPSQQLIIEDFTRGKGGVIVGLTGAETNTLMTGRTIGVLNDRLEVESEKLKILSLQGQAQCVEGSGKMLLLSRLLPAQTAPAVFEEVDDLRTELASIKNRLSAIKTKAPIASSPAPASPTAGPSNSHSP